MKSHKKTFGKNLKRLRKKAGFTQEDFARVTGFTEQYVSEVERGVANPKLESIFRLAQGLEVHPAELFRFGVMLIPPEQQRNKLVDAIRDADEQTITGLYAVLLKATEEGPLERGISTPHHDSTL